MNIEQIAVDEVSRSFTRIECIDLEVASKDRTAFTDGHMDLYRAKVKKDEFLGRVPVQVKGKVWRQKHFGDTATFNLSLKDARGYLELRGVLLFVVKLRRKTDEAQVYARMLTPMFLRKFVLEAGSQKTQVVKLPKLPSGEEEVIALANFSVKASGEAEPIAFDPVLFKRGATLTIYSPRMIDFSRPVELGYGDLDAIDHSLIVRTNDGMTATLDGVFQIYPSDYIEHALEFPVSAGEVVFAEPRGRKLNDNTLHISLSDVLSLTLTRSGDQLSGKVNLTEGGSFSGYLDGVNFFLEAYDEKTFRIGEMDAPFEIGQVEDLERLRARRRQLTRFREVFEVLEVCESQILMEQLDERSRGNLETIYRGLIGKERIPAAEEKSGRVELSMCGRTVELMCYYDERENEWELIDLFALQSQLQVGTTVTAEDGTESHYLITPYDFLNEASFEEILNLHVYNILPAYRALPESPILEGNATGTVLKLIASADNSLSRAPVLLGVATELNAWLRERDPENVIHRINEWQIIARSSELTSAQKSAIYEMSQEGSVSGYSRAVLGYACAILLEDAAGLQYWAQRLTDGEKSMLWEWPIVRLIQSDDIGTGNGNLEGEPVEPSALRKREAADPATEAGS
jgi:hypothetical protein